MARRKIKIYCPECKEPVECVRQPYTKITPRDPFVGEDELRQHVSYERIDAFQCIMGHTILLPEGKGWYISRDRIVFREAATCPECGADDEHQANVRGNEYLCLKCKHRYTKDVA